MAGVFHITVRLGNDAMRTGDDVAGALNEVAERLTIVAGTEEMTPLFAEILIRDVNGNRVGVAWMDREEQ